MFLKRLTLKNVRCFKELELDFSHGEGSVRKWTVILGENGAGKSTILRAAALVTAGSDALAEIMGDPARWVRNGTRACEIRAVLRTKKGEEHTIGLEIGAKDSLTRILSRSELSLAALNDALAHTQRNYFVAAYGTSRRLGNERAPRQKTSGYRSLRAQSMATLFDNDAMLSPLEAWAMDLHYQSLDTKNDQLMKTVRSVLSSFLPGLEFARVDREAGTILFKTPDGLVPLHYLSDGYQNVAAWVGDLLRRVTDVFDDYRKPLEVRGLLIIDEVDLHLHPKWQRSLYSFLQKKLPNLQLIVTTHSPVTAQQADEQEIHYLTRRGKAVSLHRFDSDPGRLLINQLLMSEAFGLETDESLEVELKKDRYRQLRDKGKLTKKEESELETLKEELRHVAQSGATNLHLHQEQVALLQRVQAELESRKR